MCKNALKRKDCKGKAGLTQGKTGNIFINRLCFLRQNNETNRTVPSALSRLLRHFVPRNDAESLSLLTSAERGSTSRKGFQICL